jgi:hypothetical protein
MLALQPNALSSSRLLNSKMSVVPSSRGLVFASHFPLALHRTFLRFALGLPHVLYRAFLTTRIIPSSRLVMPPTYVLHRTFLIAPSDLAPSRLQLLVFAAALSLASCLPY